MTSFVEANRQTENTWEVFCIRCKASIGVMKSDTLVRASLWALNKGGVQCPDCRQESCEKCGQEIMAQIHFGPLICFGCKHDGFLSSSSYLNRSDKKSKAVGYEK